MYSGLMSVFSTSVATETSRCDSSTSSEASDEESQETINYSDADSTSSVESDLADLYESFDFKDKASGSQDSTSNNDLNTGTLQLAANNTPIFPNAQLTAFQSHLLLFQYCN